MQEMIRFGMKSALLRPSLDWKFFTDERVTAKMDERIYIYTDNFIKRFVGPSIKGGKLLTNFLATF